MNGPLRVKESDNENLRLGYQKQVPTLTLFILMSFCFILNKEILLVFLSILFFLFVFFYNGKNISVSNEDKIVRAYCVRFPHAVSLLIFLGTFTSQKQWIYMLFRRGLSPNCPIFTEKFPFLFELHARPVDSFAMSHLAFYVISSVDN